MGLIKRLSAIASLCCLVFIASIYFTLFHHPPAAEILKNQAQDAERNTQDFNLDPDVEHSIAEISRALWAKWLYKNNYVSIGDTYDGACDIPESERITVGKLVLLPNLETNGVKVKVYTNTTFDTTTVYGKMWVLAHYNGRELYNNALDLCTLEEEDEEKVLQCPIRRGWHYFVKEHNVSPLLPKGDYKVKIWIDNQDKKTLLCSHFSLRL